MGSLHLRLLLGIAFVCLMSTGLWSKAPGNRFDWVAPGDDSGLWQSVTTAFATKLEPDNPEKVSPVVAHRFRYIHRIGKVGDSVLVVIGERVNLEETADEDYFLSSIFLDASDHRWKIREWPDEDVCVFIGSDVQYGADDENYEYRSLYSVRDFNGDGLEDIAVWMREEAGPGKQSEEVAVYTMKTGVPTKQVLAGRMLKKVQRLLCQESPGNSLCQPPPKR